MANLLILSNISLNIDIEFSVITKPTGGALPFDLKAHLTKNSWSELVLSAGNEKALLSLFLAKLAKYDPDLLIGHDLSVSIHLLANRMEKLKVRHFTCSQLLNSIFSLLYAHFF